MVWGWARGTNPYSQRSCSWAYFPPCMHRVSSIGDIFVCMSPCVELNRLVAGCCTLGALKNAGRVAAKSFH